MQSSARPYSVHDVRVGSDDPPMDASRIGAFYFAVTGSGADGICKMYQYTGSSWARRGAFDCEILNAPADQPRRPGATLLESS